MKIFRHPIRAARTAWDNHRMTAVMQLWWQNSHEHDPKKDLVAAPGFQCFCIRNSVAWYDAVPRVGETVSLGGYVFVVTDVFHSPGRLPWVKLSIEYPEWYCVIKGHLCRSTSGERLDMTPFIKLPYA